ncbi:hypothetical protein EMIT0347P_20249 [Pseudomonas sp. IT-347P]
MDEVEYLKIHFSCRRLCRILTGLIDCSHLGLNVRLCPTIGRYSSLTNVRFGSEAVGHESPLLAERGHSRLASSGQSNQVHSRQSKTYSHNYNSHITALSPLKNQGVVNLGKTTPSTNLSTPNLTLSPPCSITTPSPSTATNLTPGPTFSPCKKLLGGPSFKLSIATAPRLPAITPLTLMSIGAV